MRYDVINDVRSVSVVNKKYFYKPKGKNNKKYETMIDEYGTEVICSDVPLDLPELSYEYNSSIEYNGVEFIYRTYIRDNYEIEDDVIYRRMTDYTEMDEDELFQYSLVFENDNFSFHDVVKIQKWLIMRYRVVNTTINVDL